jgi:hypothetical protein
MIGLPFLPRSPRWLAKVDRVEEAIHVLANIQAGGNLEDPYVIAEYEEIITVLTAERLAPSGWRKFVNNGMWKRTLAGFSVQAWQQLSGANVMTYYVVCKRTSTDIRHWMSFTNLVNLALGLYLLHGKPRGKRQSHLLRCAVCPLHYLLNDHVLLCRQDRP